VRPINLLVFRLSRANIETLYSYRQDLVVVISIIGSGKKILDGEILKTTTVGFLQFSYYTILLF
jgi:hypothetical protein